MDECTYMIFIYMHKKSYVCPFGEYEHPTYRYIYLYIYMCIYVYISLRCTCVYIRVYIDGWMYIIYDIYIYA
jgi:hypothetical protein